MRYEVIIDVNDKAEWDAFEDWLKKYQNAVVGISENSGCGCCVDIFTIEVLESATPLAMFGQAATNQAVELHYGLEKNHFINDYLNHH